MNKFTHHLFKILSGLFVTVFGVYPLIPERFEYFSVIFLIVFSLVSYFLNNKNFTISKPLLKSSLLFFVFLISAILSENWSVAFKKVSTMSSLIIMPFCFFFLLEKTNCNLIKLKNIFFKIFFVSNMLFCFASIYLFSIFSNPKYPNKDANFFRNALLENAFIGDHPIYISLFLSVAILIGISFLDFKKTHLHKTIPIILGLGLITSILLLLMSKSVILALMVSLIIALVFYLKLKFSLVVAVALLFSLLLYVFTPIQNNRFLQVFNKKSYETVDTNNSTATRANIIKCSIQLISQKPVLGYGLGDVQENLDKCYKNNKLNFGTISYNSHNQYLYLWLSSGFIGLILFLYWMFTFYRVAFEYKDYILMSVLILFSISFLFENVLSRQSGVIFFTFIINFLSFVNMKQPRLLT